jgi:hypothetical protein
MVNYREKYQDFAGLIVQVPVLIARMANAK